MKKIILLLSVIVLTENILAQTVSESSNRTLKEKRCWIDLQVAQHFGLNDWNNADFVNDGFPGTNMTELRGVLNLYLFNPHIGAFADMGVGIMPAPRMRTFDIERMPMPNNGTEYYLREIVSESGSGSAAANFKMTFGLFGRIFVNEKSNVMPYLGVGFLNMPQRGYDVILKEQGTNMQYNASYEWNKNEYGEPQSIGYLNARVNFTYRISPKSNLLLGLEYTRFYDPLSFYGKFTNSFNANVWKDFSVKGTPMNMLGLSAGISFR